MKFSYKVSEAEFLRAWKLERKASTRSSRKTAAFWILLMLCLLLLYKFLQFSQHRPEPSARQPVPQATVSGPSSPGANTSATVQAAGPFIVLSGVWILIVGILVPMRLRHLYRKDPRMQGEFTVNITPDSISTDNTAGTTSKSSWNVYDYWCEGRGVIVLMFYSGAYSILSLAGLSAPQQDELRGVLVAALKKK